MGPGCRLKRSAIGLDDVAQGRLSLVLDRESQPYRPARDRLRRFGQAVSEMVLDPFAKESARHLNFQGAAITAEPQPHPFAKPEPKPRFTQPLGDRCAQGRLDRPRINRPLRSPLVRMFMLGCSGCTAMTPSPAPSSLWAYTRVVAGRSFLTAGAKHPRKPIVPKISGNRVPWPCAGLRLPGAACQPRTYALWAGCCQKGKMGKTHGKQSDRRYLADLTIEGRGIVEKGIPSIRRCASCELAYAIRHLLFATRRLTCVYHHSPAARPASLTSDITETPPRRVGSAAA